jgi:hypothetical protein
MDGNRPGGSRTAHTRDLCLASHCSAPNAHFFVPPYSGKVTPSAESIPPLLVRSANPAIIAVWMRSVSIPCECDTRVGNAKVPPSELQGQFVPSLGVGMLEAGDLDASPSWGSADAAARIAADLPRRTRLSAASRRSRRRWYSHTRGEAALIPATMQRGAPNRAGIAWRNGLGDIVPGGHHKPGEPTQDCAQECATGPSPCIPSGEVIEPFAVHDVLLPCTWVSRAMEVAPDR